MSLGIFCSGERCVVGLCIVRKFFLSKKRLKFMSLGNFLLRREASQLQDVIRPVYSANTFQVFCSEES